MLSDSGEVPNCSLGLGGGGRTSISISLIQAVISNISFFVSVWFFFCLFSISVFVFSLSVEVFTEIKYSYNLV